MPISLADLGTRVAEAREEADVPGLTVAVLHGGRQVAAAAGVLNAETQVEARADSLFQIGSITKALTATLIMQLAEEGCLDLDAPVSPMIGSDVGRGSFSRVFTARHLMAHTSGLDGDLFVDTGRDEDALAKYAIVCGQLEFMCEPGRFYNYSNAGYAMLGRLAEIKRRAVYDDVLRDHVFGRIGAGRATTFVEEAVYRRTATGHVRDGEGRQVLAPSIRLPRSLGPAGFTAHCSVEDLIAFARAHLEGGSLLSSTSMADMRSPQVGLPDGTSWGLGWKIIPGVGGDFVGHDGGTIGQSASLWMSPAHGLAVAMCCNGGRGGLAWERIAYPIFREMCGDVPRAKVEAYAPAPRDLHLYEGCYDNAGVAVTIRAEADHLVVDVKQKQFAQPAMSFALQSIGGDRFRTTLGDDDNVVMAFMEPDARGVPGLFYAGRLHRRREASA